MLIYKKLSNTNVLINSLRDLSITSRKMVVKEKRIETNFSQYQSLEKRIKVNEQTGVSVDKYKGLSSKQIKQHRSYST